MTQNEETKTMDNGFMSSKISKVLLTVIAVFITFAGPTYAVYGLNHVAKVDLAASSAVGFALFIIGLVLIWQLLQKKIIT